MANNPQAQLPTLDERLWEAVKESDEANVRELLAKGAKANFEKYDPGVWGSSHRESIIHVALRAQPMNKTIIQLLLDAGANPNANYEDYNWKGSGSTQSAFLMALEFSLYSRDSQLLQIFLASKKADINRVCEKSVSTMRYDGSESWYPIHTAVRICYYEAVKLLLEHGAAVDAIATNRGQSEYGQGSDTAETALHIVCGHVASKHNEFTNDNICNTAQVLLEHGANANAVRKRIDCLNIKVRTGKDDEWQDPRSGHYVSPFRQIKVKETPLHIALLHNNTRLALLLLRHGADPNIPWIYEPENVPCINLMPGDLMSSFWSPQTHQYFPKDVQRKIKTILLCSHKLQWKLPKEILCEVIQYSLSGVKNEWTLEAFQSEQKKRYETGWVDPPENLERELEPVTRQRSKTYQKMKSKCVIS